jgi:hypothetical protein
MLECEGVSFLPENPARSQHAVIANRKKDQRADYKNGNNRMIQDPV